MKVQILRPNHCILLQPVLIVQLGLDRLWVEQPSYHAMASRCLVAKIVAKISLSWPIWFRNCIEFLQLFQISLAQVDCELVGLDLWWRRWGWVWQDARRVWQLWFVFCQAQLCLCRGELGPRRSDYHFCQVGLEEVLIHLPILFFVSILPTLNPFTTLYKIVKNKFYIFD